MNNISVSAHESILVKAPNLFLAFNEIAKLTPNDVIWRQAQKGKDSADWLETTYGDLITRVKQLIIFLKSIGVGESVPKIAICSNSRPEWLEADLAILGLGGAVVSIYTSLPKNDLKFLLADSGADFIFAENESQVMKLQAIREEDASLVKKVIVFEPIEHLSYTYDYQSIFTPNTPEALSYQDIDLANWIPEAYSNLGRSDLASIVYTSGSTGKPKGVLQSHGNHLTNLVQSLRAGFFGPQGSMFLYLPLAHSFAKLIGYIGIFTDTSLAFPSISDRKSSNIDLTAVTIDLQAANCEYLPSIPRLFEKVKVKIIEKSREKSLQSYILRLTIKAAEDCYSGQVSKKKIPILSQVIYKGTQIVRNSLKAKIFGSKFKFAISGGAKLSPDIAEFFAALDVTILQGYGLTETCVATNVNLPNDNRIGSVGPTFEGMEIKIAEDGEIFFKGPNVCSSYHNRPEETAATWDADGWFKTGDLGYLDQDGYLYITGRKKEVIVTASGKKVVPVKVEQLLESSNLIEQAVVFGNDRPYCVALIVLRDRREAPSEVDANKVPAVWEAIQEMNDQLASFEKIRKARIIAEPFSIENGLLTPTSKLKRNEVRDRYKDLIWDMYDNTPHPKDVEPQGINNKTK
jgi:long-chain acyl-CoA synthetase